MVRTGRKVLKEPQRPVGLRSEYISEQKTPLILYPGGDTQSTRAYTVQDKDASILFTVTGWKFSSRSCREVRDGSGLPLFEIHQGWTFARNAWVITLPGCDAARIATCRRRGLGGDLSLTFENMMAMDSKGAKERSLTIDIEKHGRVLALFDVVDGDRRIMDVGESIQHNKKLALMPSSKPGYRPAMDVMVMPGVDMSLVSFPHLSVYRQGLTEIGGCNCGDCV